METKRRIDVRGDISIYYSGGLDSTFTAFMMAKNTKAKINLLTFIHNYGILFTKWSEGHVRDLRSRFGEDRIIHNYYNTTDIFKKITLTQFFKDLRQYRGHFIWCLGCVLAMTTRMIIYNLEHCIPNAMFCSSVGGEYAVMSMPVTIIEEKSFYKEYGMNFYTPLLELNIPKSEERKALREDGFWLGLQFRRCHYGVQPICTPGLQHIGDIVFDLHTTYDPQSVKAFIMDKKAIMRSIIEDYFKERNMDIQNLINAVNCQRERCEAVEINAG